MKLTNRTNRPQTVHMHDNAYGLSQRTVVLPARGVRQEQVMLAKSDHWYDLTVSVDAEPGMTSRFAGHVETGRPSITDPALGKPILHA